MVYLKLFSKYYNKILNTQLRTCKKILPLTGIIRQQLVTASKGRYGMYRPPEVGAEAVFFFKMNEFF